MKPLVIDLFCGLGGWSEAFIAEGYRAVGFDIEAHDYGSGGYPGELVLRDIRSINGAELVKEYGVPAVIVASPPCQEFSYMAMPWSKAKEKMRKILADPAEQKRLTDLFNQCFRIQREVSAAAGHYVPMVVENVKGAQRWVGRSRFNFGSFHLWGDVPALMPIPGKVRKTPEGSWDTTRENYNADHNWQETGIKQKGSMTPGEKRWCRNGVAPLPEGVKAGISWSKSGAGNPGVSFQTAAVLKGEGNKTAGMNWSDRSKKGQDFTRVAGRQAVEGVKQPSESGRRTAPGNGARFTSRDCGNEGVKVGDWLERDKVTGKRVLRGPRATGSKSKARKQASAEIAKIPPPLASWIARCFKPVNNSPITSG
jgi:site-specific DNA-cytosine methylase